MTENELDDPKGPEHIICTTMMYGGYFLRPPHDTTPAEVKTKILIMWSDGAMALGNLSGPGHPTIWMLVGQGPTMLAVGAGEDCLDIFTLIYPFSPLSLPLGDGPI